MKNQRCPCCGRKAKGENAEKRVAKWLQDARIDRLMVEKLGRIAEIRKAEWVQAVAKLEEVAEELEQAAEEHDLPAKWASVAPEPMVPVVNEEEKKAKRLEYQRAYNRAYYRKKKARIKQLRQARDKARAGNSKGATIQ